MNVDDPHRKCRDERRREQAHVAGQRNEIGPCFFEHRQHGRLVRTAAVKRTMIDDMRRQPDRARVLDPGRTGTIRDDADDLRIQLAANDRVMNRGEVRTAAGEEDC